MPRIGSSSHGESRLRLLRIVRRGDRHDPRELVVSVRFEGDFVAAFREGRGEGLLPRETLKNVVYATAREHGGSEIEALGMALCARVLAGHPLITRARVEIAEQQWSRLDPAGKVQGQAFMAGPPEVRTTAVTSNGEQVAVVSGLDRLTLMRTWGFAPGDGADSGDDGLSDGLQRLLVGTLSARWTYSSGDVTFRPYRQGVRAALIETFAWHASKSVQHTLYAMADVVLASYQELSEITLSFQERPYRPADLFTAGLDNPEELFVSAEEPLGIVEVTVER